MALLNKDQQTTPEKASRSRTPINFRALWRHVLLSEYFVLYLSIAYFLVLWPIIPDIATGDNLGNLISNASPLLTIAIGQTFVLIVAGIDLSQTSVVGLTSIVGAMIMTNKLNPDRFSKSPLWGILISEHGSIFRGSSLSVLVAILVMLLLGALVGLINGTAITRFKMPPFMVTLVTQTFFSALAIWLTKSENIIWLPTAFIDIGNGSFLGIQYVLVVAVVVTAVAHILLSRTLYGRWFYAIGTNARTALVSGVPEKGTITLAYVFSGLCAAIASVLYSSQLQSGSPALGQNILLDVIGATVIGGTSLFGGKGKVLWTIFGVVFFILLDNSLNLLSLSDYTVTIVKGAVILVAALLNVTRVKLLERRVVAL